MSCRGCYRHVGELTRAQRQSADYVIVAHTSTPRLRSRGIREQGLDARFLCLNVCADELLVEHAGKAAEGALGILPFAPPQAEGDTSAIEEFSRRRAPAWTRSTSLHPGLVHDARDGRGHRQRLESGLEVTGPAIKAALESMGPVDKQVTTAIDFSSDSHDRMSSARLYQVTNGTWSPIELTPVRWRP
ncbi:MAG: hypothetical protein ACRDZO_09095 [Egibacteraceae bacterium]